MKATTNLVLIVVSLVANIVQGNWQEWWTYDGISGPGYWGVINPAWTLCNRGRHQVRRKSGKQSQQWNMQSKKYPILTPRLSI